MANLLRGGKGRPLHPMLVHFPLALYPASLLFDGLSYLAADGNPWVRGAFALIVAGLAVSLPAAVTGFADFLLVESGTRTWRLATTHMTTMLVASVGFLGGALLRARDLDVTATPAGLVVLSLAGAGLLAFGGLLGGDLVYRHGRRVEAVPATPDGDAARDPDRERDHPARP
ncbi:MAG TPA: DUF2231 domain-containing protein [Actinomycetes bacterium]|jgi:uncharacterized membrane protein|nr:DUF2231 domain-containing protein [Actinomycetes bacterium]